MKVCVKCQIAHPLSEYVRDRSRDDGLYNVCKSCVAAYHRAHRAEKRQSHVGGPSAQEKYCPRCQQTLPAARFYSERGSADGLNQYCIECSLAASREYRARHKDAIKAQRARRYKENPDHYRIKNLKNTFNLTLSEYNAMLLAQGGVCAICGKSEKSRDKRNLAVDHDHATGAIRGLLCGNCNKAIGCFQDDVSVVMRAARYLQQHAEQKKGA